MRPTSQPKPKARRSRRRPDPFVTVTERVRRWFEAEPWRTSRELFERLQQEQPGAFPDGQRRTLQRRLKGWRREMAHRLVSAPPKVAILSYPGGNWSDTEGDTAASSSGAGHWAIQIDFLMLVTGFTQPGKKEADNRNAGGDNDESIDNSHELGNPPCLIALI